MKIVNVCFCLLFLIACKAVKTTPTVAKKDNKSKELSEKELQTWYRKDLKQDHIPGISLEKWYAQNKEKPKLNSIIVAVIDTQIDLMHEDLKGQFWTNPKEIPDNGIDDDHNGYIDDTNGWSFLGTKSGNYIVWKNFEFIRIIRKWQPVFKGKTKDQIAPENAADFKEYQRALAKSDLENANYTNWLQSTEYSIKLFPKVKDTLKHFFPKEDYSYTQLDSLYKKYKINDKTFRERRLDGDQDLGALIGFMKLRFEFNEKKFEDLIEKREQLDSVLQKNISVDYNERLAIDGDLPTFNHGYGNNKVLANIKGIRPYHNHSTEVSGVIAANRENNKGIKGFSQRIKIMPLNVSASGDEHDKDIANAIRYAVDNGAKIINMSFSKEYSLRKDWVFDALQYAESHNVLVVHCAGNEAFDADTNPKYPSDFDYSGNQTEISHNFINVGAVTHNADSTFVSDFSNYGKKSVDLFAPGSNIYTTFPDVDQYISDSGTSLAAPMVSGTAALIWLYYPNLLVSEVKDIILESGDSYDFDVLVPGGEGKKMPFKELSKSGRVLNVYNAMQLAEKISRQKSNR